MSFNEMHTSKNALRNCLVGDPVTAQTGVSALEMPEWVRALVWRCE